MWKFFKYLIVPFFLLIVLALLSLFLFVNPNRFKPFIASEMTKLTKQQVTIDGDLAWTFFPTLGVKIDHLTFSSHAPKNVLDIRQASISVPLKLLLSGHLDAKKQPIPVRFSFSFSNSNSLCTGHVAAHGTFAITEKKPIIDGDLQLENIHAARLAIPSIRTHVHFQNQLLAFTTLSAKLYDGTLDGQASFQLKNSQLHLQTKLAHVQIEPLLKDLSEKSKKITLAGLGAIDLDVTTVVGDQSMLLHNLNGTLRVALTDGAVVGIDLGYVVESAYQMVQQQPVTARDTHQTHFGSLTGTGVIQQGIVTTHDLLSDAPRFVTHGQGTLNLVTEELHYSLQTSVKQRTDEQKNNWTNLYDQAIPIIISGHLDDPHVRLDSAVLLKGVAQEQIQKLQKNVSDKVGKFLKDNKQAKDLLNGLLGR